MERRQTNDDLCTPQVVIDAVLRIDDITLDPCSNRWSQVPARIRLDGRQGRCGLEADWAELTGVERARRVAGGVPRLVYCNPPYGRGHMARWAEKIAAEADGGCEIVALVKGDHSTAWWRLLRDRVRVICYWDGRISFEGGAHGSGNFASALLYFGRRPYRAADAWASCGDVRVIR